MLKVDVIIIGAGASGLMCAIEAGKRGRSVLVLEHTGRAGSKIGVSGGGRCNFTNRMMGRENYLSRNPHFSTSALSRFRPADFISLLEKHGIGYEEREAGQLFCNGSSGEIIDMLVSECEKASVKFEFECTISEISGISGSSEISGISGISGIKRAGGFSISTSSGSFQAESLVIATGGLSYPNLGAGNFGYVIARQFGIRVTKLSPALTPLRFNREDAAVFGGLAGISVDCVVRGRGASFRGNMLFTHKGLSGPAVLQFSSYWDREEAIVIDLLPSVDIYKILLEKRDSKTLLPTILGRYLPGRFARLWCDLHSFSGPINSFSPHDLQSLALSLHEWRVSPRGTEGFNKAEVTLGGVDTDELSSKTMECKRVPGLYFLGEVIDVTGRLGGYNLHWAWASGHAAGQYV